MIRIVSSTNRAEVEALLSPAVIRDRATERAAARIVARVRAFNAAGAGPATPDIVVAVP
jgi:hypothetical protein